MTTGEPYVTSSATPIAGELLRSGDGTRPLLAWLPPGYADRPARRYPVLLAHDGDNLFDEATSHAGEWLVDEAMTELAAEGMEAIVIGVPHHPERRADEYSPWTNAEHGGGGGADAYLDELVGSVLPLVRSSFRVRLDAAGTGILGSSLGGLVSLYGLFRHAGTFGFAGVMSPAFWWAGDQVFDYVAAATFVESRIWIDVGGSESREAERNDRYVADAERMVALLTAKGYGTDRLRWTLDEDAPHHETAWARRFPDAMRFFLS